MNYTVMMSLSLDTRLHNEALFLERRFRTINCIQIPGLRTRIVFRNRFWKDFQYLEIGLQNDIQYLETWIQNDVQYLETWLQNDVQYLETGLQNEVRF